MSDNPWLYLGATSIYLDEFIDEICLNGLINSMLYHGVSMKEISDEGTYRFLLQNLDEEMAFFLMVVVEKFKSSGEIPKVLDL